MRYREEWNGLTVHADVVDSAWEEGLADGTTRTVPAYCEDTRVYSRYGDDITELLTEEALQSAEAWLLSCFSECRGGAL